MISRAIVALAAVVSLSACSSYPPLVATSAVPPADAAHHTELDLILAEAVKLQTTYGKGYQDSAQMADLGQLPIIGAAAAAAWILLDDKKNAATIAGKIGIGAGTYSAVRGQLSAAGLPDLYIAGHGALTCVLAEGSLFAGTGASQRRDNLDDALTTTEDQALHLATKVAAVITPTTMAAAWRRLDKSSETMVDLVSLGNPHFSHEEFRATTALVRGRRKHQGTAIMITCG
ncbi:MAG: DUF521 domain-containing protein, partial [Hyphomicrobiales bacterium]